MFHSVPECMQNACMQFLSLFEQLTRISQCLFSITNCSLLFSITTCSMLLYCSKLINTERGVNVMRRWFDYKWFIFPCIDLLPQIPSHFRVSDGPWRWQRQRSEKSEISLVHLATEMNATDCSWNMTLLKLSGSNLKSKAEGLALTHP